MKLYRQFLILFSILMVETKQELIFVCPGRSVSLNCSQESPRSGITWRIWCQCSADTNRTCEDTCSTMMPNDVVNTGDASQQGTVCEHHDPAFTYSITSTTIEEGDDILVPSSVLDIAVPHQETATTLCVECLRQFSRHLIVPGSPSLPNNLKIIPDYTTSTDSNTEVNLMWLPATELSYSELDVEYTIVITELDSSAILYNHNTSSTNFTARLQFNTTYSITLYASKCNHTLISESLVKKITFKEEEEPTYSPTSGVTTPATMPTTFTDVTTYVNQSSMGQPASQDTPNTTTISVTMTTTNMRASFEYIVIFASVTAGVFLLLTCALTGCFIVLSRRYCSPIDGGKANSERSEGIVFAVGNTAIQQSDGANNPETSTEGEYSVLNWKALGENANKQCRTEVLGEYKMITLENLEDYAEEEQYSEVTYRTAINHSTSVQIAASSEAEYSEIRNHAINTERRDTTNTDTDTDNPSMINHAMYSQVDKMDVMKDDSLDLDKLVSALRKQSELWRSLASSLRIPKEQVEVIGGHCQSDFDSLVEVCDAWLSKMKEESRLPTWQEVISALEEASANELADKLKEGSTKTDLNNDDHNIIEDDTAAPPIPPQLF